MPSPDRGLDWLNLFVANIQTGFGPFVAVYLTTQGWTQTAIGLALSLGTITAMASQLPAGALVDAIRSKAAVAFFSILAFTVSALMFALLPIPLFIYIALGLHGFSSCTLGPAIAAISLLIAGPRQLGIRLGRNARFAAIGNGVGAALMGVIGYWLSERAVFFLTAGLTLPAFLPLLALTGVREPERRPPLDCAPGRPAQTDCAPERPAQTDRAPERPAQTDRAPERPARTRSGRILELLTTPALLVFAVCVMLFTLGNAAMMPLASTVLTKRATGAATLLIAACIVLPQLVVAVLSPVLGRIAEIRGRRLVMLVGFCTLPIRGLLFAAMSDPSLIVLVQVLDGVAGAALGVLVPLVTSDIAGRSGHYNLSLGFIGFMVGVGATFSTSLAGWIADRFGDPVAFAGLAGVGLAAMLLVWAAMPETRPE
ncbi:MAG: MFS transporter [Stellaceae bacterium]